MTPENDPLRVQIEDAINSQIVHPYDSDGSFSERLPDELREFFLANNVSPKFNIILKKFKNENRLGGAAMLCTYRGEIPTYDGIAAQFGTGPYRFCTSWKEPRPGGKGVDDRIKDFDFDLEGQYYENLNEDFQARAREARLEKIRKRSEEDAIKNQYLTGKGPDPMETMSKTMGFLEPILKLTQGNNDTSEILKALITSRGGGGGDEIMKMVIASQAQMTQIIVAMVGAIAGKSNNNNQGDNNMDHAFNVLDRAMQITDRLSPKQTTVADRIMDFLGDFSGPLLEFLAKKESDRTGIEKMMVEKVKKSQEVAALRAQKNLLVHITKTGDERLGPEKTDQLLRVLDLQRPPECAAAASTLRSAAEDGPAETAEPDGLPDGGSPDGAGGI